MRGSLSWLLGRERKRSEIMAQRRQQGPPPVVAFLPLSKDANFQRLWSLILAAFTGASTGHNNGRAQPSTPQKHRGVVQDMEEDTPLETDTGADPPVGVLLHCSAMQQNEMDEPLNSSYLVWVISKSINTDMSEVGHD
jgi:hypothetical protein